MGLQGGEVEGLTGELAGRVIWYDRIKGYGFLAIDGYDRDVFVHSTEVRNGEVGRDYLLKGEAVRCKVALRRGRPLAVDLALVPPA